MDIFDVLFIALALSSLTIQSKSGWRALFKDGVPNALRALKTSTILRLEAVPTRRLIHLYTPLIRGNFGMIMEFETTWYLSPTAFLVLISTS
ncbi:hypothetical protein CC2G_002237 [Coprinopsis cinerea AmutBmut pab1-1]|nr:hypothetical protein CC2G_002237 [Coprinopsis cinerea AmutBmut pab1-1]